MHTQHMPGIPRLLYKKKAKKKVKIPVSSLLLFYMADYEAGSVAVDRTQSGHIL